MCSSITPIKAGTVLNWRAEERVKIKAGEEFKRNPNQVTWMEKWERGVRRLEQGWQDAIPVYGICQFIRVRQRETKRKRGEERKEIAGDSKSINYFLKTRIKFNRLHLYSAQISGVCAWKRQRMTEKKERENRRQVSGKESERLRKRESLNWR